MDITIIILWGIEIIARIPETLWKGGEEICKILQTIFGGI